MNIKLTYLYRIAANYKQYNEVVFANPSELPIQKIQSAITKNLIDENWFIAKDWNLLDLHFKKYDWDDEIDHDWHEFSVIEEKNDIPTAEQSVEELIERISYIVK